MAGTLENLDIASSEYPAMLLALGPMQTAFFEGSFAIVENTKDEIAANINDIINSPTDARGMDISGLEWRE